MAGHLTVTVELLAGPLDGLTYRDGHPIVLAVPAGKPIPEDLEDFPGYYLKTLRNDVHPARHVYYWLHAHTGQRRGCSKPDCGPGCPSRQMRRGGTT